MRGRFVSWELLGTVMHLTRMRENLDIRATWVSSVGGSKY